MNVISRKDARDAGLKRYFTGSRCKHGHISERFTSNGTCMECNKSFSAVYMKEYRSSRADEISEYKRLYRKANPDKCNANNAKRRAQKLKATPSWLTEDHLNEIQGLYKVASDSECDMHVDHIVPLLGDGVCGLHVPWNLRVIPASDNMSKGNKL